jgi:predicted protein tyrosine phosphatase
VIPLTRAWDADRVTGELHTTHRVIIADPRRDAPFPGIRQDGDHLHLAFHDAAEPAPNTVLAAERQIAALVNFAHAWGGNRPISFTRHSPNRRRRSRSSHQSSGAVSPCLRAAR